MVLYWVVAPQTRFPSTSEEDITLPPSKGRQVQRAPRLQPSDFNRVKSVLTKPPLTKYPELQAVFQRLPELRGLVFRRMRLVTALSPALRRVNPSNPNRSTIEKSRTVLRKTLRAEIAEVETQIAVLLSDIILTATDPRDWPVSPAASMALKSVRDPLHAARATAAQLKELETILSTPTKQRKRRAKHG